MKHKKLITLGLVSLIGIGTYLGFKRDNYPYVNSSEMIREAVQESKQNAGLREKVEKQIEVYNSFLKNKNKPEISRIFLSDCHGLSKSSKKRYLQEIIDNNYNFKFEFLLVYDDGLRVGISLNNEADVLEGKGIDDLHLRCNYF